MPQSRNEGYVAVNRLTGGYLAHHQDRRKLKTWVLAKARPGMWVDIEYHANGGGIHKVGGFLVHKAGSAS